jgi:hypothetical protein
MQDSNAKICLHSMKFRQLFFNYLHPFVQLINLRVQQLKTIHGHDALLYLITVSVVEIWPIEHFYELTYRSEFGKTAMYISFANSPKFPSNSDSSPYIGRLSRPKDPSRIQGVLVEYLGELADCGVTKSIR